MKNPNWRNNLLRILQNTRKDLPPIIVIRKDDPAQSFQIHQFFVLNDGAFARLGITCSFVDSLFELVQHLFGLKQEIKRDQPATAIQIVVNNKSKLIRSSRFVMDNCHHLLPGQLFYLLGLITELEHRVQFWFFFTQENFDNWKSKHRKDKRIRFFLNTIQLHYEI